MEPPSLLTYLQVQVLPEASKTALESSLRAAITGGGSGGGGGGGGASSSSAAKPAAALKIDMAQYK